MAIEVRVLSDQQCSKIVDAAMHVCEKTGCLVKSEKARNILLEHGATGDGERMWIPRKMIEDALKTVPNEVKLYDTEGNCTIDMKARGGKSYWSVAPTNLHVLDRHTGEKRDATAKDVHEAGLIAQALPNIAFANDLGYISEQKALMHDLYAARELLTTSTKARAVSPMTPKNCQAQVDIAAMIAGGADKLRERPTFFVNHSPTTPFVHNENELDKAMVAWENGIPCKCAVTTMMGGTAPITYAGAYTVGLADFFVQLVLCQLVQPGLGFLAATGGVPFDMKTLGPSLTGPEDYLSVLGNGDLFRYLNIPFTGLLGGSHSPVFDQQAALDMSMGIFMGTLAGCSLGTFGGFLESGDSGSIESLVYLNEVIAMADQIKAGIEVDDELIDEEAIDEVGPGKDFLTADLTIENLHSVWRPNDIIIRDTHDVWKAAGAKDLGARCREKADAIIEKGSTVHRDPQLLAEIDKLIASIDATY